MTDAGALDRCPRAVARPLPRLQVVHLLMGMAVTAAAFVPYRAIQENTRRMTPTVADVNDNPAMMFVDVASGVLQGACLFAAVAVLVWKRGGYEGLPQPGHYFAYRSAALWAASLMMWGGTHLVPLEPSLRPVFAIPYGIVVVLVFIWFLRLSRRESVAPAWRRAFVVTALAPAIAWLLMVLAALIFGVTRGAQGFGGLFGAIAVIQGMAAAFVAVAIILAMIDDRRRHQDRHWSHFIGPGARLAEACGHVIAFAAMGLYAAIF